MRCLALLVAIAAAFVLTVAINMTNVLHCLDSGTDLAIAPLVRGDLRGLFCHAPVWSWPSLPWPSDLLVFGPAAVVLTMAALLLAASRRWRHVPGPVFALLALLSGVVPYAVGAIALRDNTDAPSTGRWLVWMLVGPAHAAMLALAFLLRDAFLNWRQRRAEAAPRDVAVAH